MLHTATTRASGRLAAVLEGHTDGVCGVAALDDGRRLVSGGDDGTVRVWEAASGKTTAVLEGHTGSVCTRVLRADRRYERLDISGLTGVRDAQLAQVAVEGKA